CLEWLPVVGVGHYDIPLAGRSINTINTTPITVNLESAHYLSLGALRTDELYGPAADALKPLSSVLLPGTTLDSISMASNASFPRDSAGRRVFLLGQAKQLCLQNGRLTLHENYSTGSYPPATLSGNPPTTGVMLTHAAVTPDAPLEL